MALGEAITNIAHEPGINKLKQELEVQREENVKDRLREREERATHFVNQNKQRQGRYRDIFRNSDHFVKAMRRNLGHYEEAYDINTQRSIFWTTMFGDDPEFEQEIMELVLRKDIIVRIEELPAYQDDAFAQSALTQKSNKLSTNPIVDDNEDGDDDEEEGEGSVDKERKRKRAGSKTANAGSK